jgi:molybdopterin adenylyltransferase
MATKLEIKSVNISRKKGIIKTPVSRITLTAEGVKGDAHAGPWNRQVSLLGTESIAKFRKETGYGEFAENITTTGMKLYHAHPLDRFISGETVLEVTQIGKKCHGKNCAIFTEVGDCVMPREGIFCRVISGGILKPGMILSYFPKTYKIHVITLSDRAYHGEYEDKSGPRLKELSAGFFRDLHLGSGITLTLLPDDPARLKRTVQKALREQADIIFTTGGTGIAPRDFTPDVIRPMLEKEFPGIMEMIRIKYGARNPSALLSRSIAGTIGETLVFTLPGSVRAVEEYFAEISQVLIHSIYMIHRIDSH